MKTPPSLRNGLIAFSLLFATAALAPARADNHPSAQSLADKKSPALPLTHSIARGTPGEYGGPFVLKLKNTSSAALKVAATIQQSVVAHNRPKTIDLPARSIEAGGTWEISDLAAEDKVSVTAEGYEKLDVTIHPPKSDAK